MSKITYSSLAIENLKEVLVEVNKACRELKIDWFIVGAVAKNIWFAKNKRNTPATKDIDFGIYVSDKTAYNDLRNLLIEGFHWHTIASDAFRLLTPYGKKVDLLPFGEIEKNNTVMIEGKGLTTLRLDGFKEAYDLGIIEVQIGEENYKACSIPAIVVLKMIAFDDRPEKRIKDVKDINAVCMNYPQIEDEMIWENYFDLYDENIGHNEVAMIVLGCEMNKIVHRNHGLKQRIIGIIEKALNQESDFLRYMIEDTENETLEMKAALLNRIKQGILRKSNFKEALKNR